LVSLETRELDELRRRLDRKLALKYLVDRVGALLALPLLGLAWLGAGLAMWLEGWLDPASRGPLLYREERWTQGRPFFIYKFRTTYPGSQAPGQVGRLTRTGRLLKKWYLDELPQLLNILRGEMTLVGPRPNIPENARREIEQEGMRGKLLLRAGLTGLVQAHKGAARDRGVYRSLEERYLAEVLRRSPTGVLAYDAEILLETCLTVLRGEGL
jgi:lipopolysaccharide/colanic/teichoic acid biosynthesis glycosyltransferase